MIGVATITYRILLLVLAECLVASEQVEPRTLMDVQARNYSCIFDEIAGNCQQTYAQNRQKRANRLCSNMQPVRQHSAKAK